MHKVIQTRLGPDPPGNCYAACIASVIGVDIEEVPFVNYVMLKSKIHKARVTDRVIDYEGSTTIDRALMDAVGILPYEQIQVYDISNGQRFETYAIAAPAGSGEVCVNGAAARLVEIGDEIIIAAYAVLSEKEAGRHKPVIVVLDARNEIGKRV